MTEPQTEPHGDPPPEPPGEPDETADPAHPVAEEPPGEERPGTHFTDPQDITEP